ncbi:hypothetical protein DFH09DRAFT_1448862 [Mycena vulgaris]|nr:hypothetical protein DFH09DRAFT_1448862 [Mycena vulgaris]
MKTRRREALLCSGLGPPQAHPKAVELAEHTFRDDALLELNPEGNHPIFKLIRTSFPQAVAEYRRRYDRDPPKSFDDWWNYVREHDVQLPDEYDQIHADLPFLGARIEPKDLHAIRSELEELVHGIVKTANNNIVVNTSLTPALYTHHIQGSVGIIRLLRPVEDLLPPFRAVFSPHDPPRRLSDYSVQNAARQAAAEKRYISRKDLPRSNRTSWTSACALDSLGGNRFGDPPQKLTKKTFIYDHKLAMDPCLHPHAFGNMGYSYGTNGQAPHPSKKWFRSSRIPHRPSTTISTCLSTYLWVDDILPRIDERLLWRGSTTGISQQGTNAAMIGVWFVPFANDLRGTVSILLPVESKIDPVGEPVEVRKSRLNPGVMGVVFIGDPIMTYPDTGRRQWVVGSAQFKHLVTSNSLVFKASIYPECDRIAPWVHYIPVQLDLSDLHYALVFFRSDLSGAGAHDELACKLAIAGQDWSKKFWRMEDMFSNLILEYTRLMSKDGESMSYIGDGVHQ